jgi:hypothetical protein
MSLPRIVAPWLDWLRWSLLWHSEAAHRTLERQGATARRRPWRLS